MLLEKTYMSDEDFEVEMKKKKPDEVFFNSTMKTEQAGEEGVRISFTVSFIYATMDKDEKNIIISASHNSTPPVLVKNQEEIDALTKEVDTAVITRINELKKVSDTSFFKRGILRVGI